MVSGKPSILGLLKIEGKTDSRFKLPLQRLTNAQMEERRKQSLCYNCDEKWQLGHKCKGVKVFLLEGLCEEVDHKSGLQLVELNDDKVMLGTQDQVQRSDNVVTC